MIRNPYLPLTETTFYILLVLTTPAHGYAIIQEIDKLSEGSVKVAAGTMYGAIENLLKLNWIEEIPSREKKRRRVYKITDLGEEVLRLEIERLGSLIKLSSDFWILGGDNMKKFRIFLSLKKKKEEWINSIQEEGYRLVSVSSVVPIYTFFEKLASKKKFIPYVRLDFREKKSMGKIKYEDYVTLFSDSGWKLIKGSRSGGAQYFQQEYPDVTRDIFSDTDSQESVKKRYVKYGYTYGTLFLLPVVLVNFNILKNISKFLQNVVVLDLIEHCKPVICFQIYSLAL
jgi:DNA-binding PadR family transcriptional regulator